MAPPGPSPQPPPPPPSNFIEGVSGAAGSDAAANAVMTNGPVTNSWERPWSLEELKNHSMKWNLAGDAGLLLFMKDFSKRILSRTHDLEQQVDSLVHETKSTDTRIHNVINDFLMLSNSQFVENRVYDEELQDDTPVEEHKFQPEKSKAEKEAELIPKISEALRLGITVIDSAFEKIDIKGCNSDSDEDDIPITQDPILEAKDPYVHRPLPYIIGSLEFSNDDNVGLMEAFSDEEQADSDVESESSSESVEEIKNHKEEICSEESQSESESGEEKTPKHIVKRTSKIDRKDSESESDGSDLFGIDQSKNDASSEEEKDVPSSKGPMNFAAELSSKLHQLPKKDIDSVEDDEEVINTKKKKKDEKKNRGKSVTSHTSKESDLFNSNESPEDDSPFSRKGFFSSGGGLFDDDREEGGLFDDDTGTTKPRKKTITSVKEETPIESEEKLKEPQTILTKSGKKLPKDAVNLFGDAEQGLFSKSTSFKDDSEVCKPTKSKSTKDVLFGEEDDDDLFNTLVKPTSRKETIKDTQTRPKTASLFADVDEEDDLFSEKTKTETKPKQLVPDKKIPAGAVSMFGGAVNPLMAALKAQKPVTYNDKEDNSGAASDEESKNRSDSRSSKSSRSSTGTSNKSTEAKKETPSPSVSSNSLFMEEPEDDLFASGQQRQENKVKSKSISLFDDEETGDFFSSKSNTSTPSVETPSKEETKRTKSNVGLLFEDEEDDLFAAVSKSTERKKTLTNSLFDNSLPDSSNKIGSEKPTGEPAKPETVKLLPKKSISIFDEDDTVNNDEDLFSATKTPEKSPPQIQKKPRSKSKMLFEDEDVLFGGEQKDSPDVDLFGTKTAGTSSRERSDGKETMKEKSIMKGDLFDRNNKDDDDLFTTKKLSKVSTDEEIQRTEKRSPIPILTENHSRKAPVSGIAVLPGLGNGLMKKSPLSEGELSPQDMLKSPAGGYDDHYSIPNTEPYPVTFDEPADQHVLQNATKDRAKIQAKRRPPSRKMRHEAARNSALFDSSETAESDTGSSAGPLSPSDDIPDGLENRIFDTKPSDTGQSKSKTSQGSLTDLLFGNDPPKKDTKQPIIKAPVSDIFGDSDDIFAFVPPIKDKSGGKGLEKSIFNDDIDDIFSEPTKPPKKNIKSLPKKKTATPVSIFDSDVPDIFDDPLNVTKK